MILFPPPISSALADPGHCPVPAHTLPSAGSSRNPRLDLESWREFADEFMTFFLPSSASNIRTRNRSAEGS